MGRSDTVTPNAGNNPVNRIVPAWSGSVAAIKSFPVCGPDVAAPMRREGDPFEHALDGHGGGRLGEDCGRSTIESF